MGRSVGLKIMPREGSYFERYADDIAVIASGCFL